MEASSLFEDLVYSLEIAGHEVGLQHYGARMLLDTASLRREYREWFVPDSWQQPYLARAELSFELDALAEARLQYSPEDIAEAFGLVMPDEDVGEIEMALPAIDLTVRFTLDLYNWALEHDDIDRWHAYLAGISVRDKLEAGLRNLRGEVRRALQSAGGHADYELDLNLAADLFLAPGHGLLAKTLNVEWTVPIDTGLDEDQFSAELEAIMATTRAGIEATQAFRQEIQSDFETSEETGSAEGES
jgi:hypothetical protein